MKIWNVHGQKDSGRRYPFSSGINTFVGYFRMMALSPTVFLKKTFQKKVPLLFKFLNRRSSYRVQFHKPMHCEIYNLVTNCSYLGWINDISGGGVRILSQELFALGTPIRITFQDWVIKKTIALYVTPIPVPLASRRIFRSRRFQSLQEYRCPTHTDLLIPEQYEAFYQRVLSDSYLRDINLKRPHAEVLAVGAKNVTLKIASNKEEKEAAYRLVYQEYIKRGFADPNPYKMFTYKYQLLPETTTFVGIREEKEVVMTISVIKDAIFGLPSDHMFKDVLDSLRQKGRVLVEYGMLSTQKSLFGKRIYSLKNYRKFSSLSFMFRMALQYSMIVNKATDIIIAIPPRYQNLYKYLCFEPLTELRYYDKYNTPALAMRLDLQKFSDPQHMRSVSRTCLLKFFISHKIKENFNPPQLLSPAEANFLFAEKSDLLERLTREELQALYETYPEMRFWLESLFAKQLENKKRNYYGEEKSS